MDIGFFIQLTYGGGRHFGAPESFGDILYPAHGDAGQIHLDERLLHAALPTAIPLDDGCLKRNTLEAWNVECDVTGGRGEISAVMTAAVALPFLTALIACCLRQFLRFGLQQPVERFFHATTDQFFYLPLDYFLI
jgi:hypothetical protein